MEPEILEYIKGERVCVIAVEMPDGSPHAATVHFAHSEDPLAFIIQTSPSSRKGEVLLAKNLVRVSLVIGLREVEGAKEKTFQLDGEAQMAPSDSDYAKIYLAKFPEKSGKWASDIFFTITPTWWRFTDWSKPEGKTVFNSDGSVSVKGVLIN